MILLVLIDHLQKFTYGGDTSIQWAKDAESLLDDLTDEGVSHDLEDLLDHLQDKLCIYSPSGGDHLIDERMMKSYCQKIIPILQSKL